MSYPRHARVMPAAQVRFRQRFTDAMSDTAERVALAVMRAADDDTVAIEQLGRVSQQALQQIDQLFLGDGGREPVTDSGRPRSLYARILLTEIGRATYEIVQAHESHLRARMPGDMLAWMRSAQPLPAQEMIMQELSLDDVLERFPQLTDEDAQLVADARIFDPNPLAEYERAHTWVDPRGYRLSDRIWRTDQETRRKLDEFLADRIAGGYSASSIARLAEQFLIPGREPIRTNRPYGRDASYDAMRLARTEIARAANQAAYISAYMNPYVSGVDVIRSRNGDRTCTVCPQHATIGISGERLRPPYPMSAAFIAPYHPNCMCRVRSVPFDDVQTVENRLRRIMERSRDTNLRPYLNPANAEAFTQRLLGEILWNITRQVLPDQPGLPGL